MNKEDPLQDIESIYSYVFNFERSYSLLPLEEATRKWVKNNFLYCYCCCIIYLIVIFGGKFYMRNRPKFSLRGPLALWNGFLAVYSIIGFSGTAPDMFTVLKHDSYYHSFCIPSNYLHNYVSGFWTWLFVLSRILEFGDTIFIVLRKQPLIFLHFYYCVTIVLYTWFAYGDATALMRWYTVLSYFVQSCVYYYNALKAMHFRLSKHLVMMITTIQIVQMAICYIITIVTYEHYREYFQLECYSSYQNYTFASLVYVSCLILFLKFFYLNYICRERENKGRKAL